MFETPMTVVGHIVNDLQRRIGAGDIAATALTQALTRLRAPVVAPLTPTRKRLGRSSAARSPVG